MIEFNPVLLVLLLDMTGFLRGGSHKIAKFFMQVRTPRPVSWEHQLQNGFKRCIAGLAMR
jgi:hypothetical protein